MAFERYDADRPQVNQPKLTIYSNLNGYLNAAADHQWFEDYDEVLFFVDADAMQLAIQPCEEGDGDYQLSRDDGRGADIAIQYPLENGIGFDDDTLDETARVTLEWDDDREWAVADVSTLANDVQSATEQDSSASDDADDGSDESDDDGDTRKPSPDGYASAEGDAWSGDYTSKPEVEAFVLERLKAGQREFTAGEVTDVVNTTASWTGRALTQLVNSDAPVTTRIENDDQANEPTIYRLEPTDALLDEFDGEAETRAIGGTDADSSDASDDESDRYWCGYCGQGPYTTAGDVQDHHQLESHAADPVVRESDPAEGDLVDGAADAAVPEPDDAPSHETIRDCAASVETLSELADLLEVSRGEARLLARDASVLGNVRDDTPRMGVGTDD